MDRRSSRGTSLSRVLDSGADLTVDYVLTQREFKEFHRPRIGALVEAAVDLLACETLPSFAEAEALLALVEEFDVESWFSFTLRDGGHISDGTPLAEVAAMCGAQPRVAAIGVNCVPLNLVSPALEALRNATDKPLLAYPNSGENYDGVTKTWSSGPGANAGGPSSLAEGAGTWHDLGARLIGGCCRTTPRDIAAVARLSTKR